MPKTISSRPNAFSIYLAIEHFIPKFFRPTHPESIFLRDIKHQRHVFISLGNDCLSAIHLRKLGLRSFSSPFDWIYGGNLLTNLDFIIDRFKDFLSAENLSFPLPLRADKNGHIQARTTTGLCFIHDFRNNTKSEIDLVITKYKRRQDRLLTIGSQRNEIFFVYIERREDGLDYNQKIHEISTKLELIRVKLSPQKIHLLAILQSQQTANSLRYHVHNSSSIFFYDVEASLLRNGLRHPKHIDRIITHCLLQMSKTNQNQNQNKQTNKRNHQRRAW